jgi:hypothetical protein
MAQDGHTQSGFWGFITSRAFWINLVLIGLFLLFCIGVTFIWLNRYTRHNQKLKLPDYRGELLDSAAEDASARTFRMHVLDSIYVVGKRGLEIIQQNPPPGALVKENRTIYVTITKKSVDKVSVSRLPILYGKDYGRKKRELYQSYQIESEVIGRRFDPGEPDHILEVRYNGDVISDKDGRDEDALIDVGGTLQFILSERKGGELEIPDLVCLTYAEAKFIIENSNLELGEIITAGNISSVDSAFVTGQVPDPGEGVMYMGDKIRLSLSANKPFNCN